MQMQRLTVPLAAVGISLVLGASALAQQRVALVIGNATYTHAPRLANPLNDAADVGAALARLGFAVTKLENADQAALRQGLLAFTRAASAAEVAVVFYAGHGIEVDQRNFLVPVDARLTSDQDVEFETVPLELVMRSVARASGLRLVILDACRENPFAVSMQRAGATRSVGRGLARVEPAGETLVAYAAKEGTVASDGAGRNSPYSTALLAHLEEPGLEVGLLFRKVRDTVLAATGGRQEPFVYGSLSSRGVYLTAREAPEPSTAATGGGRESASQRLTAEQLAAQRLAAERELLFWESVKDSTNPADLQAYLDRYPGGTYEVLARNRLQALRRPEAAAPVETATSVEDALRLGIPERRLIQLGLAAAGFDPGPVDGLFGQKTRRAIGRWQASRGAEATGHLDVESAKVLLAAGRAQEQTAERRQREREARQRAQREAEERERREAAAEAERRRRAMEPGRRFRDCPDCPEMVVVPAGSFMMGSPATEQGRYEDEGPVHRVTIAQPFAVGVHEVTRGEFARFVRETNRAMDNGCSVWDRNQRNWVGGYNWRNPGFEQTDRHPVVCVSWVDAQAYVGWLSQETGQRYRLLSESEWEYVARAGTRAARWWGESASGQCRHANGADVSTTFDWRVSCNDGHARAAPVGTYTKNGYGLHDVLGNVWEWTQDCWNGNYRGAPMDGRARGQGEGDCSQRVKRGGSWYYDRRSLRSAVRSRDSTRYRGDESGFRLARTLTP